MSKPVYSNYLLAACCALAALACHSKNETPPDAGGRELPVQLVPNLGNAAESYFSPDGKSLICNAKREGDQVFHTYTVALDGSDIVKINDLGADACSFYFPGGGRLIFTSTRDNLKPAARRLVRPAGLSHRGRAVHLQPGWVRPGALDQ